MSLRLSRRQAMMVLSAVPALGWPGARAAEAGKLVMHKSATCGCCGGWASRMREAGFVVEEIVEADMAAIKARLGVPEAMASCHTAELDGYLIEGHVPAQAIRQVLAERPKALGVAAPGMPMGAPGMEMGAPEVYALYLFDGAESRPFGRWRGDKPA